MEILKIALYVVLVISSLLMMMFILMHKGRGGGLSDMFGGGISAGAGSSGVAERNLNIITTVVGVIWLSTAIAIGLLARFGY